MPSKPKLIVRLSYVAHFYTVIQFKETVETDKAIHVMTERVAPLDLGEFSDSNDRKALLALSLGLYQIIVGCYLAT